MKTIFTFAFCFLTTGLLSQDNYTSDLDPSYLAKLPESNVYILDSGMKIKNRKKFKTFNSDGYIEISGIYSVISKMPYLKSDYLSGKIHNPGRKIIDGASYHIFTLITDNQTKHGINRQDLNFAIGDKDPLSGQILILELDRNYIPVAKYKTHLAETKELSQLLKKAGSQKASSKKFTSHL
ncbi:MAG: hypothetical protein KJ941_01955 [Bacteroidetes bacterium]|nr:hypothetical protein [Bacteroidota bacterium]